MIYNDNDLEHFNSPLIAEFRPASASVKKTTVLRYHYTSPEAMLSILKGASLRFTDIRYMNDRAEIVIFVQQLLLFLEEKRNMFPGCWEVVNNLLLKKHTYDEYVKLIVRDVEYSDTEVYPYNPIRRFVFCMGKSKDSLHMWNYYIKSGNYQGYNIGFNVYSFLKSFDTAEPGLGDSIVFRYGNVIYNKKDQKKEIEALSKQIEKKVSAHGLEHGMVALRNYIDSCGAFFKSTSFSDEEEFRVVIEVNVERLYHLQESFVNSANKGKISLDFFSRGGVLVPYLAVPFNKKSVKKITIAPTMEHDIVRNSMEEFLALNGYSASVVPSAIPVRY